ncbi:MAG: 2OG-Fe(II) oxygenase [Cyanobacteria bacterium J06628_6]
MSIRCEYPLGQQVNSAPVVHIIEEFISQTEIDALVTAAEANLQQALVSADQSGVVSQGRTGRNCWVKHRATPEIGELSDRISRLVDIPLTHAESYQLIHYFETQTYKPHYDAWEASSERGQRCMVKGGQRLVTCLLYLNTVTAGGGTCFPKLDMEVRAVKGRMVIFHNCFAGTNQRHPDSLHGGLPVERGEKWACNLWFREKSLRPLASKPAFPKTLSRGRGFKRVI